MINLNYHKSKLSKTLTTTFLVSFLTCTAVFSGMVPKLSLETGKLSFSQKILAQNSQKVEAFAKAVAEIEKLRQPAFNRIEAIVGKEKTAQLACHKRNIINQLPANARTIAENYCKQSSNIVRKYGLTNSEFNQFTRKLQQDPSFQQQVQNIIRRM